MEINVKSLEGQPASLETKIRNGGDVPYRKTRTGEHDENYYEVFLRLSLFLDKLIKLHVDKDYNSGITKLTYEKVNDEAKEITENDVKDMFQKGLLSSKEIDSNAKKKVLLVVHGGIISEILNNVLIRMKNEYVNMFEPGNSSLFCINIAKNSEGKVGFSFELFNDESHLKK